MSKKRRYVVVMPIFDAELVALMCYERGLDVDVFDCFLGSGIVRNVPVIEYDEWDIRNITGPDARDEEEQAAINADPANRPWEVARAFAQVCPDGVILAQAELTDEAGYQDGLAGNVSCTYISQAGEEEETSIGYVLATAPDDDLEHIILDDKPEHVEMIHVADITTEQASSWLADLMERFRKLKAAKGEEQ